jgi:hypothetical protein
MTPINTAATPADPPASPSVGGAGTPANSTGVAVPPPTPTATPTLNSLYTQNPGAGTFAPSNTGVATTAGTAPTANASLAGPLAGINNGQINSNDSTNAASQLDAITNSNSPYIQQAEQQGLLSAASRGLENSSMGAGAAEGAAVAAAAPLAEQNAAAATQGQLQNSQLGTQANEFNASQENSNQQLNAQLQTQQTQFNASQEQAAAATNTAAKNAMTQQTMQLNEQINQQYLSGTQSQSLASIQGQYNELIQQNASAAGMYNSMMTQIGATMGNKDIAPQRVADTISAMQTLLSSGLQVIDGINGGNSTIGFGVAAGNPQPAQGNQPGAPGAKVLPKP